MDIEADSHTECMAARSSADPAPTAADEDSTSEAAEEVTAQADASAQESSRSGVLLLGTPGTVGCRPVYSDPRVQERILRYRTGSRQEALSDSHDMILIDDLHMLWVQALLERDPCETLFRQAIHFLSGRHFQTTMVTEAVGAWHCVSSAAEITVSEHRRLELIDILHRTRRAIALRIATLRADFVILDDDVQVTLLRSALDHYLVGWSASAQAEG